MRLSGKLRAWNDERGYGFIAPSHGGAEIFVHISALPRNGARPTVGETLTYEPGRGRDGKPQALHVLRTALTATSRNHAYSRARTADPGMPRVWKLIGLLLLIVLTGFGYRQYQKRTPAPLPATPVTLQAAPPAVMPSATFRCDGRTRCSQMTSCAEATFFLRNCPGTRMDGNHDGVPCEQQWCPGP